MGIQNFQKNIKQKYGLAFKASWLNSYDHVYIDINFALHYCSYGAKNVDEIYDRLYKFIDGTIQELAPKKSLVLTSDGSAPLAKLLLQRKRRLNASRKISPEEKNVESSSLIFTPGTEFMNTLCDKLKDHITFINKCYAIEVIYLDGKIDEAELKLKRKIMDNIEKCENDTHVIVSNDSDVVVMLGTLDNFNNVYVFYKINHQGESLSILRLIDLHTNKVGTSVNPGLDFSAISIMLGNDYIPKINFVNFDNIWNSYKHLVITNPDGLVNKDLTINKSFLVKLLFGVIRQIKPHFVKKHILENSFVPLYKNYMDGYLWCLHTYYEGLCTRYNYMYEHHDSPHPLGLIFSIENDPAILNLNMTQYLAIDPTLYAMLVLPKASNILINKKYHVFLENSQNILYNVECCKECAMLRDKIKKINDKIAQCEDNETLCDNYTKQASVMSKNMTLHKKQHDDITVDDIEEIKNKFNKFCLHNI